LTLLLGENSRLSTQSPIIITYLQACARATSSANVVARIVMSSSKDRLSSRALFDQVEKEIAGARERADIALGNNARRSRPFRQGCDLT